MIKATADSAAQFLRSQVGKKVKILAEREVEPGVFDGYTENYTPAHICGNDLCGRIMDAIVVSVGNGFVICKAI